MRILVTGCNGYIGKHLMRYMGGHDIFGIDIETDITDLKSLEGAFEKYKPDVVIHTAGLKSVQESFQVPSLYSYVNVQGTKNILDCMTKYGTGSIIFSSSATVYDNNTEENSILKSTNPYGETKIQAEKLIVNSGLNYCILRYFNPVGSDEDILSPNLYPTCLRSVEIDDTVTIYGDCVRDYFYIVDLARFHNTLLTVGFDRLVMNFGIGVGMTTKDFITLFEETNSVVLKKIYKDKRHGDKDISVANVEKFRTLFPEFIFTDKKLWLKIVVTQ
jgi:UDP-glucose 4-epimerase